MVREDDDAPFGLGGADVIDGGCEPVEVGLVGGSVRCGGEGFDAPKVRQRPGEEVKVVRVECGPEGAADDGESWAEIVASSVEEDKFTVGATSCRRETRGKGFETR